MAYSTRDEWRRYKKRQSKFMWICCFAGLIVFVFGLGAVVHFVFKARESQLTYATIPDQTDIEGFNFDPIYVYDDNETYTDNVEVPDWIDVQIIDIDGESRQGILLDGVNDIVVHYVGNPGTTAQQNHDYYTNPDSEVSSHFVIGLEGEIIQCVPLNEKSSASNWRNKDTISIEVCHPDDTGKFNDSTYASLVKLTAWLLDTYNLDEEHIIRHYDITGKECPRYYVQNEDKWQQFKNDVTGSLDY